MVHFECSLNVQNMVNILGRFGCRGMKLEVIVTNPAIDWMESILCSGAGSCKDVQMTVTKDVPRWATNRQLLIGELECESPESCRNGMFDLGVGVQFARCTCGRKAGHFYIYTQSAATDHIC